MVSQLTRHIATLYQERPNVALLMSLGGTNAEKILADEEIRDLYNISSIVTDSESSRAAILAEGHGLDFVPHYVGRFSSPEHRENYFNNLAFDLGKRGVQACFYAGFMKIAKGVIIDELPGVNSHPADLTQLDDSGVPLFRGMHAIDLMRESTSGMIGASVHSVDHDVDSGDTFIRSKPFAADLDLTETECHALIKPIEHVMYPLTLRMLGKGVLNSHEMPYTYDPDHGVLTNNRGDTV